MGIFKILISKWICGFNKHLIFVILITIFGLILLTLWSLFIMPVFLKTIYVPILCK